jgi:TetR/AcrR family transcriptional repressor of nem operon
MRYPDGHKETVRAKIVDAASKALRQHGLDGIGIPALMKSIGLTHGGFYSHFRDRDELVAAAIMAAASATAKHVFVDQPDLAGTLALYLSKAHLDRPYEGCVLAALGTDATRQSPTIQRAFADAARGFLYLLEKKLHPKSAPGTLSDDTLARGASMIGALVLGRLVGDETLAARVLSAVSKTPSDRRAD